MVKISSMQNTELKTKFKINLVYGIITPLLHGTCAKIAVFTGSVRGGLKAALKPLISICSVF